jgi:hypothetical protein
MLPDGLLDMDLINSKLPLADILRCKTALKAMALAYSDENNRLKVLMPVREYMQQHWPPSNHLVHSLLEYFQELLEVYVKFNGTQSNSSTISRIAGNFSNIQNVVQWGLDPRHTDLFNSLYCACYLNRWSRLTSQTHTHLIRQIHDILPQLKDHRLQVSVITEILSSWHYYKIPDPDTLISQGMEHSEHHDDTDLKCMFYFWVTSCG